MENDNEWILPLEAITISTTTEPENEATTKKLNRRNQRLAQREKGKLRRLKRSPQSNFPGKHKWLGGSVDPSTGIIYGVPSHSYQIICIHPPESSSLSSNNDDDDDDAYITTIALPNEYKKGHFKWLRGVIHNGYMYGIPAWSTYGVLKVRLLEKSMDTEYNSSSRVQILPLPHSPTTTTTTTTTIQQQYTNSSTLPNEQEQNTTTTPTNTIDRARWMWHGGTIGKNKNNGEAAIYCIPSNAERVLKVNLENDKVTEIGPNFSQGQNKWYGGILGCDGCVYGIPYTATGVIRIDPNTDTVCVIGDYPYGGYKWHGGLRAASTGFIYAFPAHANTVLCIDTNPKSDNINDSNTQQDQSWRVSTIPIHRHPDDTDSPDLKYKWLGGAYGADGCIYGMPSDATFVLKIDPITNQAFTIGSKLSNQLNKWQGGVLSNIDNCVYAVPADADCVLRIKTDPTTPTQVETIGNLGNVEDKWQGGFLARDGRIYGIPETFNRVMKLTPGENPTIKYIT